MHHIAVDLGAGSGRVIVGSIENGTLKLTEIHRFSNPQLKLDNVLYWNFLQLFQEIKEGIKLAVARFPAVESLAVDTWGVDFGLLDASGKLLGNPVCYRDARTSGILDYVFEKISKDNLYKIAGTQIMEINTAFQLLAMNETEDPQLAMASDLLFMPDLFNYFLTGKKANEYTIASTSNFLDAQTKKWSPEIMRALQIPEGIMNNIVMPGELLGTLTDNICSELETQPLNIYAVGSHDTASAAAITWQPGENTAFISSGTWSLLGMHLDKPILTTESLEADMTNEGGVNNKILYLKNITGLWLLQCAMKEWEEEGSTISYDDLLNGAAQIKSNVIINPDNAVFSKPDNMCDAIADYCENTNQKKPENKYEFVRIILDSLAYKYKDTLAQMQQTSGVAIEKIHIVGGGCRNNVLNQLTSDVTGLPVIAGPVEATAIGNIVTQAIAAGNIKDYHQAMEIISQSFDVQYFYPQK